MPISLEEGNSFCEYSIAVCKQHCLLWCRVCDVCWPSAGRTPAADCGQLRTEPACYPYLTDYVDIHSEQSNTRDGDYGATVLVERSKNPVSVPVSIERLFCSP